MAPEESTHEQPADQPDDGLLKKCRQCGVLLVRTYAIPGRRVYCNRTCSRAFLSRPRKKWKEWKKKPARPPSGLSPSTLGAVSELAVAANLMANGWAVFRALSPSSFCDLIAFKDGVTRYLEARTGREDQNAKITFCKDIATHATEYAVYVPETGKIVYLEKSEVDRPRPGRGGPRGVHDD